MSTTETAAIRQTLLDYIEGFYDGDAARIESLLHPELAKRIAHPDPGSGRLHLAEMSTLLLTHRTRDKASRPTPKAAPQKDVTVLDMFQNADRGNGQSRSALKDRCRRRNSSGAMPVTFLKARAKPDGEE
ncbi:MAG: nuclear transport factor 2 family protein [Reyranella sp.]|uniref:nuclear transport factor 2 family protein n=1 Tax=Reyranella sp. TaxID=1929291 RepID=UPI0025E1AD1F|nr:nuclear transport factor 2 family protein [Reyranella sp.]MBR2816989.1 nuclear transport factor 2 family protein [Reyranella sp.]